MGTVVSENGTKWETGPSQAKSSALTAEHTRKAQPSCAARHDGVRALKNLAALHRGELGERPRVEPRVHVPQAAIPVHGHRARQRACKVSAYRGAWGSGPQSGPNANVHVSARGGVCVRGCGGGKGHMELAQSLMAS